MPESAYGPTNNCVGIGNVLLERGHRVVFAAEASWRGKLAPLGFVEDLVDLAEPPPPPTPGEPEPDAGQFWKDFVRSTAPEFRKPTIAQLDTFVRPVFEELIAGARYCEPQLREIIARHRPDVVIEDNVVVFPALQTGGAPYVRIVSCNPLEIKGSGVAPTFSGLPADDKDSWAGFRAEYERTHRPLWQDFDAFVREQGAPGLPEMDFMPVSDRLNLYVYPEELDYVDARPLDGSWQRLESCVRTTDAPFELPDRISTDGRPLAYFSLGSLGSADLELMQRTLDVLATTPYRFVVSMGPRDDELTLGENMWGSEFVPQTTLLPMVDLVITHGGNNTTTEAMHFGKPMVLLPIFWDQHDNAQRVHERGYGVRLDTYRYTDDEMVQALRDMSAPEVRARAEAAGRRIRAADGVRRAAELIEAVAG
ncbi:MAG: glycosyltransferase [Actinomycetales bacterium]